MEAGGLIQRSLRQTLLKNRISKFFIHSRTTGNVWVAYFYDTAAGVLVRVEAALRNNFLAKPTANYDVADSRSLVAQKTLVAWTMRKVVNV